MWKKLSGKKSEDEKQADSWQAEGKRDKTNGRKRGKQRGRKQRKRDKAYAHRTDEENEQKEKGRYAEGKRGCNERKTTVA